MKKIYLKPSTIEVKVEAGHLLENSIHNEKSTNASYSRQSSDWEDE
jgi:hypothetical protein